ncbi:MAG TPA: CoA-binding protein [Stellaceae bacterium]|jgi:acyl-CoA synthetase (NDP forming)|nr:CoA-binding protein [Stellaceae bacterium]
MQLDALFKPESIAVIGASDKPTPGRRIIASLDRLGFAGRIYPINPNYAAVLNRTCYKSVADLPEAPDIGVFCLGHERVLDAFIGAAKRGMRAAVIYDGGFAEQGPEGRALQTRIEEICREADIALCGPNCMGVLNPHHKSSTYLQELRDPAGLAGNVGIISHSGGLCVGLLTDTRRFGFSHIVSSGNEAVVTAAEFLEYLVDDPETRVIGCFIETVRQPARFAAALDRAAAKGKPVVILKVGRSERTRRSIVSHTGGPVDEPGAVSEMFRAHGAIEVSDLVEFTEVLAAAQGAKRPAGRKLAVITSSGGLAELILDIAEAADLRLPPLSAVQKAEIELGIGFITGDGNPLDAWGSGAFAANLPQALSLFDASPEHDAIVILRDNFDDQPFDVPGIARAYLEQFAAAAERSRKPHYLLNTRSGIMDRALVAYLRERGIATVTGLREGLGAIDRLARNAG